MVDPILLANANSPYLINGPLVVVVNGEENRRDQRTIALCHCAVSQIKPFNAGTHRRNGFQGPAIEIRLTVNSLEE